MSTKAERDRQIAVDSAEGGIVEAINVLAEIKLSAYRAGEEVGAGVDYVMSQLEELQRRLNNGTAGQPMAPTPTGFMRPISES